MRLAGPLAVPVLMSRLKKGREDPFRWREKLGETTLPRPTGRLVWLHAVGLGEVLALRGLIRTMQAIAPDLEFLVTSSARSSGDVFARNAPPRTRHQFLPLDTPGPVARFLDHWKPDLSVWSEQDLWPGLVAATARRNVPLALVNARMGDAAFNRRRRLQRLYRDIYRLFDLIEAQDAGTAGHLEALGAPGPVAVSGSLKAAADPLPDDPAERAALSIALAGRKPWLAASTHREDEAVALAAQQRLFRDDPTRLLVIAPRDPERRADLMAACRAAGLSVSLRSENPTPGQAVHIVDRFGELGLWYRLCPVSLVGGSFGPVEGHNPWEPAALGSAILHGPRTGNFTADYGQLTRAGAARLVSGADDLVAALLADLSTQTERARHLSEAARAGLDPLARRLLALLPQTGQ
jgi:3-deoxy-D-manno-octulosonic-acid transferase